MAYQHFDIDWHSFHRHFKGPLGSTFTILTANMGCGASSTKVHCGNLWEHNNENVLNPSTTLGLELRFEVGGFPSAPTFFKGYQSCLIMSSNQCAPAKLDRANVTYRSIHVSVTLGHRAMDYWSTFVHSQTPNKKCEENGTNWIFTKSGYVGSFEKVSFNKFHYHIWKRLGDSLFPTRGFNSPKRLWRNVQIGVQ